MQYKCIKKEEWDKTIGQLLLSYTIFACVENEYGLDYELLGLDDIKRISYNKPKPATPLKSFFLPFREDVTSARTDEKPRIIMGIPNCDLEGLCLPDEIYLDETFEDIFYRRRRENTLLISSDCFSIQEHCHCTSYSIKPYSEAYADLAFIKINDLIILRILSVKGEDFIRKIPAEELQGDNGLILQIKQEHLSTEDLLSKSNNGLPDYKKTRDIVLNAKEDIWKKYSSTCVSCGACTSICPTCTCFLLIDKPGFKKVKQLDACQYPGFERVAAGEDPLRDLDKRFRNRYMCKYVWKPGKFRSPACTGCGRCIEACIGKINKNELFMELVK